MYDAAAIGAPRQQRGAELAELRSKQREAERAAQALTLTLTLTLALALALTLTPTLTLTLTLTLALTLTLTLTLTLHRQIRALGWALVTVPYFEWQPLRALPEPRSAYLQDILATVEPPSGD